MTFVAVAVLLIGWVFCGVLAARMALVWFERQYGSGTAPTDILWMNIVLGPAGLFTAFVTARPFLNTLNAAWGIVPVDSGPSSLIISRPRTKFMELLGKGIKGLPPYNYEDTYEARIASIYRDYNVK